MLLGLLLLPLYLAFAALLLVVAWGSISASPAWAICALCVIGAFVVLAWPKKKRAA